MTFQGKPYLSTRALEVELSFIHIMVILTKERLHLVGILSLLQKDLAEEHSLRI